MIKAERKGERTEVEFSGQGIDIFYELSSLLSEISNKEELAILMKMALEAVEKERQNDKQRDTSWKVN